MLTHRTFRRLANALLIIGGATGSTLAAAPVPAASPARASTTVLRPLTVQKKRDLDFGALASNTGGTLTINPFTSAVTTTGGVVPIGGAPAAAKFTGAAQSNSVVIIRIPKQDVVVKRVGGNETMIVNNWTLDGPDKRAAAKAVSFDFHVGGTLNVGPNQTEGLYEGSFSVEIQYP